MGGLVPKRMGNAHMNVVPYQVFATQDGHIVLAVGNDGQFARFCELAGHAALARDERYLSNAGRITNRDTLIPVLAGWMLQRSTQDWIDLLEPNAVPCAPILTLPGVFQHPQVMARGVLSPMEVGADRPMPLVGNPMRFDGERALADQPPPGLDAQGDAIRAALAQQSGWPVRG